MVNHTDQAFIALHQRNELATLDIVRLMELADGAQSDIAA